MKIIKSVITLLFLLGVVQGSFAKSIDAIETVLLKKGTEPRRLLRMELAKGQEEKISLFATNVTRLRIPDYNNINKYMMIKTKTTGNSVVKEVINNSSYRMSEKIIDMELLDYKNLDPNKAKNDLQLLLSANKAPVVYTLKSNGKRIQTDEKSNKNKSTVTPELNRTQQLSELIENAFSLPNEPVGVGGGKWVVRTKVPIYPKIDASIDKVCKVIRFLENGVKYDCTVKGTAPPQGEILSNTIKGAEVKSMLDSYKITGVSEVVLYFDKIHSQFETDIKQKLLLLIKYQLVEMNLSF